MAGLQHVCARQAARPAALAAPGLPSPAGRLAPRSTGQRQRMARRRSAAQVSGRDEPPPPAAATPPPPLRRVRGAWVAAARQHCSSHHPLRSRPRPLALTMHRQQPLPPLATAHRQQRRQPAAQRRPRRSAAGTTRRRMMWWWWVLATPAARQRWQRRAWEPRRCCSPSTSTASRGSPATLRCVSR